MLQNTRANEYLFLANQNKWKPKQEGKILTFDGSFPVSRRARRFTR